MINNTIHTVPYEPINGKKFLHIQAALNRFMRFRTFTEKAFPNTANRKGIVESDLLSYEECSINALIKNDHLLTVSGTVYDRGYSNAIYRIAEGLAQKAHMLLPTDDYSCLLSAEYRELFSKYSIEKTGNELIDKCINVYSKALGFSNNATPLILDSEDVFMGCAAAALRLKVQLFKKKKEVNNDHPLYVFLPYDKYISSCGIIFGLKMLFADNVHCYLYDSQNGKADIPMPESLEQITEGLIEGTIKNDAVNLKGKTNHIISLMSSGSITTNVSPSKATILIWEY